MTPIERIRIKSDALATLGITGTPNRSEIKKAYRQTVKSRHPDRGLGTSEELMKINEAFEYLMETTELSEARVRSTPMDWEATVHRPTKKNCVETVFDAPALAACQTLHDEDDTLAAARHVATRMLREGRSLTFVVPSKAGRGTNRITLATTDLAGRAGKPVILTVRSMDIVDSLAEVPPSIVARLFPGAKSVSIAFTD